MSNFTTVYNQILSVLATIFSEKTRLYDAYSLSDNPDHIMRDAFGLRKGSTIPSDISELCRLRDDHTFTVVLTREVIRHDSETTPVDDDVKALCEDAFELRERFFRYDKLGLTSQIENITLGAVGPVERVRSNSGKFFSITIDFTVQIAENLQ